MRVLGPGLLAVLASCTVPVADLSGADGGVGADGSDGTDVGGSDFGTDTDGTDGGDGTDGPDGTDGGGGGGDGDPDYSGTYRGPGSMGVYYTNYTDYSYACEFETSIEVTSSGRFDAEANCEIEMSGPNWDVTGTWEGTVVDGGLLTGEMEMLIETEEGAIAGAVLDLTGTVTRPPRTLRLSATASDLDSSGYELTWFSEVEAD